MTVRGRPRKMELCCRCREHNARLNHDITFILTMVASWLYSSSVIRENTPEAKMLSRLRHEVTKLQETDQRARDLEHHYHEYLDLRDENIKRKKHIETLVGLIGGSDWESKAAEDALRYGLQLSGISDKEQLQPQLPLWEAMREYLKYVPETRINEMTDFFERVGFTAGNRQAIESALKRHPSIFKIRKQKREKYISLK